MRYLFFDIECCDGKHICEFGYVITDEKFNILEKKDITINPDADFDLVGRPNQKDLYLFYPEAEYYDSDKFPYYYNDIKALIEYEDQLIVGHAIINDAKFLRTACKRYKLAPINFKFADSQRMFSEYINIRDNISLESASESLKVKMPQYLHKSDDDSELTMNLTKNMCDQLDCTLEELIGLCDSCTGKSENNEIEYDDFEIRLKKRYDAAKSGGNNKLKGGNYRLFLQFINGVRHQGDVIKSSLNGKRICFSLGYERNHFIEMMSLVQLLANHNAIYKKTASDIDVFVSYNKKDEETNSNSRLNYVNKNIEEGKNIQIISLDELLSILNVKEEDLSSMPFPKISSFYQKTKSRKRKKKARNNAFEKLGDLFPELLKRNDN